MKLSGKYITLPLARRIVGMRGHETSAFNRCVGGKLFGQKGGGRASVRERFSAAAKECRGKRG